MSTVHVIRPGLLSTVQDLGRWGHQAEAVPVSGAMDPFAHRLANALVANPRSAATIEVTLNGPELQFDDERTAAVAGAEFELFLDDRPIACGRAFVVRAGSTLRFGARRSGARAYIAVAGGFDVPIVLGSRSTHVPTNMGGVEGRALKKGDGIPLGNRLNAPVADGPGERAPGATTDAQPNAGIATAVVEGGTSVCVVRVMAGPQHHRFESGALDALTAEPYIVGTESNRMAYRLEGRPLQHLGSADIISDATPVGCVQVPSSGQPLLLMADRQTTGGYAKIATVITADQGIAGQVAPGDRVQFSLCDRAEAIAALIARERVLLALEQAIA